MKLSKLQQTRFAIQMFFLGASILLFLLLIVGTLQVAHKFCPYAVVCFGLQGFLPQVGEWLYPITIALGLLLTLSVFIVGRIFCSYACPIGTVQELVMKLRGKKYRNNVHLPLAAERFFGKGKYIVFLFTVVTIGLGLPYLYIQFCPVIGIAYPLSISIAAIVSLAIIVLGALLTERIWCRFLCPYAALMNLVQYLGVLLHIKRNKIYRNLEVCIECRQCNRHCPMNIDLLEKEYITNANCIHCKRCLDVCPKKDALTMKRTRGDKE